MPPVSNSANTLAASKEEAKDRDGNDKDTAPPKVSTTRRPPANVGDFVYEEKALPPPSNSLQPSSTSSRQPTSIITIYCTSHAPPYTTPGFETVSRLEQYAFLLNVALRRLYALLRQRNVITPGAGKISTGTFKVESN